MSSYDELFHALDPPAGGKKKSKSKSGYNYDHSNEPWFNAMFPYTAESAPFDKSPAPPLDSKKTPLECPAEDSAWRLHIQEILYRGKSIEPISFPDGLSRFLHDQSVLTRKVCYRSIMSSLQNLINEAAEGKSPGVSALTPTSDFVNAVLEITRDQISLCWSESLKTLKDPSSLIIEKHFTGTEMSDPEPEVSEPEN